MENNLERNQSQPNSGQTGSGSNPQGNIGSAGSEGTQSYNNGNEGRQEKGWGENSEGLQESGNFDSKNTGRDLHEDEYEGGQLGTAGSGGLDIPAPSGPSADASQASTGSGNTDVPKVPVPIVEDNYEGGQLGTAGSGGMDIHGSESSLSTDALNSATGNALSDSDTGTTAHDQPSKREHGAGPAQFIPDGSNGTGAKQPKEHTGKDTEMGGATGGTSGLGYGNNEGTGVGNKDGSESGSGGGGSSEGSNG